MMVHEWEGQGGTLGTLLGQVGAHHPREEEGDSWHLGCVGRVTWAGNPAQNLSLSPVPCHTPEASSSHAWFSFSSRVGKL